MDVFIYIICGLAVIFLWYISSSKRKGHVIPGPTGWPVLGCLSCTSVENMHNKFYEYAGKYGDIVRIKVLGTTIVTLNSVDLVQAAFSGEQYKTQLNDRPSTFIGEYVLYNKGIAFSLDGNSSYHSRLRKIFTQGFHVYGDGIKIFEEKVKEQILSLKSSIEAKQGNEFDLMEELKCSLSNLLSVFLSGEPLFTTDNKGEENIFWEMDESGDFIISPAANAVYTVVPFIRFLPGLYKDRFDRVINAANKIHKRFLTDIKATQEKGNIRGYVDFLLNEQTREHESGNEVVITEQTIRSMLIELVGAGILTTYSTLCNMFLCLINNPRYQTMAREEIGHVIGDKRPPTLEDRAKCPIIEAIIMETLRLLTTAPFGAPHTSKSHIEFEGYDLPAKTMILVNFWYIHHSEKTWGDPWSFRPERFLDESGQLLPRDHPLRRSWIPFGLGRRQCVGEQLARSRMFLYTASLLQRWTFIQSEEGLTSCDPRTGDFNINITLRPKRLHCRVEDAIQNYKLTTTV